MAEAVKAHVKNEFDGDSLKKLIRGVPDFPKKGILFYDITTLLKDKVGFAKLIDALSERFIGRQVDLVLGGALGGRKNPSLIRDLVTGEVVRPS